MNAHTPSIERKYGTRYRQWLDSARRDDWTFADYQDEGRRAFDSIPLNMRPTERNREAFAFAYAQVKMPTADQRAERERMFNAVPGTRLSTSPAFEVGR